MRISDWSSDVCSSDLVRSDGCIVGLRHAGDQSHLTDTPGVTKIRLKDRCGAFLKNLPEAPFCKNAFSGGNGQMRAARNIGHDIHVLALTRLFDEHRLKRLKLFDQ